MQDMTIYSKLEGTILCSKRATEGVRAYPCCQRCRGTAAAIAAAGLPPSCCHQVAATKLPPPLPSCPLPQSCRYRRCAAIAAAALPPHFPKRCHQVQSRCRLRRQAGRRRHQAIAATATATATAAALPPPWRPSR
jgi:hypothetical protein